MCTEMFAKNQNSFEVSKNGAEISDTSSVRSLTDSSKWSEAWAPVWGQLEVLQKASKNRSLSSHLRGQLPIHCKERPVCPRQRHLSEPGGRVRPQGHSFLWSRAPAQPDGFCWRVSQPNKNYYYIFFKYCCTYILRLSQLHQCFHLYRIKP